MENELYEGWLFPDEGSKHDEVILDFLYSDSKLFPLWGSVSSGKTVTSSQAWALLIRQTPKQYPLAMIGKTELTLEANVLDPLTDFLGSDDCYKSGNVAWIYGRKVRLYGANDAKSRSKIQGKSLYAWYGDEVTTWPEDFFMMALSRLRVGKAKAIMTMNPESKFHWFHKQVIERADNPAIKAKLYHFTMADNPHLPDDYKAWISSLYVPGTVWYKRWIQGEWAAASGAIYPFLTDDPKDGYVIDTLPSDFNRYIVAMDYGQQHYTAMGLAGFSPSMNRWVLFKEHYTSNKTNGEYSKEFGKEILSYCDKIAPEAVDVDSGGGGLSLLEELRADYPELDSRAIINHAIKVDVDAEIQKLAKALFNHEISIYRPGCPQVVEEMMNYVWDEKAKGRGKDEPVKRNDDGCDMMRYLWNRVCYS
jgi:PBSX family phage terminase large subunit